MALAKETWYPLTSNTNSSSDNLCISIEKPEACKETNVIDKQFLKVKPVVPSWLVDMKF